MADPTTEDELLAALGVDLSAEPEREYTQDEERLIAGFEDIQRFVADHGHAPRHGAELDIFERLYAVRLDRLREISTARELLAPFDHHGLLAATAESTPIDAMSVDELLARVGADAPPTPAADDITILRHVRSAATRRTVEEIADRKPCKDFARFRPLFERVQRELDRGLRQTLPFGRDTSIEQGEFFILDGHTAYVAAVGEEFDSPQGKKDARLRVIFDNATESDLLRLSLVRALYKDPTGRRITDSSKDMGPLFGSTMEEGDTTDGTIYVLRSQSELPFIAEHRELIHKIGVTAGSVERRIANAKKDPTYLLAGVEVVASYELSGIQPVKLENLLHRIFAPAQLELHIADRFGHPVNPREWFLVPLGVIDEAVDRIRDGSITDFSYHPESATLEATEPS